ncbi:MAG: hypothetical protein Q4F78_07250 [Bacillota bacterium]|nr:hypothetical protein [Bacillota bacterium]
MTMYRNKKTGATIETPCKISGENWQRVQAPKKEEPKDEKPKKNSGRKKKNKSEVVAEEAHTVADEEVVVTDEEIVDEVDIEGGEEE